MGNGEKEIAMLVLLEQLAVREGIGYTYIIRVYHCGYSSVEREIVTLELQTVVMIVVSEFVPDERPFFKMANLIFMLLPVLPK